MARIAGVDIPKDKRGEISLTYIYGIGRNRSRDILEKAGVDVNIKVKDWKDNQLQKIRQIISDEYIKHPEGVKKEKLIKKSDIIIIATPHKAYKKIKFPNNKEVIDTWGLIEK